jgi:hypothetical protein
VPTLEDFLAGKSIPAAKVHPARPAGSPELKPTAKAYISAFDVFSTADFSGVMHNVGNKIELVGRVVAVKHGVGKKGRGKGKPYTFINFSPWRGNIVKLTIWSEGLTNMSSTPSEAWAGRWVSVTGLVDPPYNGKHYGNKYTHVGITLTATDRFNSSQRPTRSIAWASVAKQLRPAIRTFCRVSPRSRTQPVTEGVLGQASLPALQRAHLLPTAIS